MPRFDGTGPRRCGPCTGWGMGPCYAGWKMPRCGWGMGFRKFRYSPKDELAALEEEEKMLKEELEEVKSEISALKGQK